MTLRVVRLGSSRRPGEGFRIGAVRRPQCHCEREERCHRSILRELLARAGAKIS